MKQVNTKLLCDYISERGGKMPHLKLQKLLYYVQAFHLAYFDQPLIADDFQAWLHGPVCRPVFDQFKARSLLHTEFAYMRLNGERLPSEQLPEKIGEEQFDLVNQVLDGYLQLSPSELEKLTHGDAPWIDARQGYAPEDHCNVVIPKESMRLFYKKFIFGMEEK